VVVMATLPGALPVLPALLRGGRRGVRVKGERRPGERRRGGRPRCASPRLPGVRPPADRAGGLCSIRTIPRRLDGRARGGGARRGLPLGALLAAPLLALPVAGMAAGHRSSGDAGGRARVRGVAFPWRPALLLGTGAVLVALVLGSTWCSNGSWAAGGLGAGHGASGLAGGWACSSPGRCC
jgi:hypothetical protein